jgi:hypothetical protein
VLALAGSSRWASKNGLLANAKKCLGNYRELYSPQAYTTEIG